MPASPSLYWNDVPFLKLIMPFLAGLIAFYYLPENVFLTGILLLLFFGVFCIIQFLPAKRRIHFRGLRMIVIYLNAFLAGGMLLQLHNIRNLSGWYGNHENTQAAYTLVLNEPLTAKQNSFKTEADITRVTDSSSVKTFGEILVYLEKSEKSAQLGYGSTILIRKPLQEIKNSGNIGAFDYKKYLLYQNIYHQVFIKDSDYIVLPEQHRNILSSIVYKTRENLLATLNSFLSNDPAVKGIAEALLIGYKEDLDKDLVQAYSNVGVVHIIAISGLHLGLIYLALTWLLERIPYLKRSNILKAVIIIGFLWYFSLVTGAPASVLRSAVMFTCIVMGKYFFKSAPIQNSLASSAFIMLIINPYYLWDVGFQLSYAAVSGIVWLQKPISNWIIIPKRNYRKVKNWPHWAMRELWMLSSASIAAQIFTLPLTLYYFHQFPLLFLISNLIAVPLSTIILFGEILLLSLFWLTPVAKLLGIILSWLIKALNTSVLYIDKFSFAKLDFVPANVLTSALMYLFIAFFCSALLYRRRQLFAVALALWILLMNIYFILLVNSNRQNHLVVYNLPRATGMDWFHGRSYMFIGDTAVSNSQLLTNFHLRPTRLYYRAGQQIKDTTFLHSNDWLQVQDKIIFHPEGKYFFPLQENKIPVDIMILSKTSNVRLEYISQAMVVKQIVADGTVSAYRIRQYDSLAKKLNIPFHAAGRDGAFVLNLNR